MASADAAATATTNYKMKKILPSTQIIMKAYNFATKRQDKIIYTDDSDFLKHFNFTSNLQYLNNLCEYINDEYSLDLDIDQTIVSLVSNNKCPIILDFSTKSLFVFDLKWQHRWNQGQVTIEEDILYRFTKFDYKSIYAPMLLVTNSTYIKPIALMILTQYKDVEGIWYIIYNFFNWASITVGINSIEKQLFITDKKYKSIKNTVMMNKSNTNKLSLPFSSAFIRLFYKTQPYYIDNNLDYDVGHEEQGVEQDRMVNVCPCYLQSSNRLINLRLNSFKFREYVSK